ncbi:MAG: hypothetical protein ABIR18_12155 [Chitinophagaceae bacterium]
MKKYLILIGCIVIGLAACEKKGGVTSPAPQQGYAGFLKNTEWVGVLNGNGYQYPPPSCMKFNPDNTITVFAPFWFNVNGVFESVDSIKGKIKSIDSLADGRTRIAVNFPYINDQLIDITDRKRLTCVKADLSNWTFQLELFPTTGISVKGTTWCGPLLPGAVPGPGAFAYPDLSSIQFLGNKDVTVYYKDGQIVPAQPTPQGPSGGGALEAAYLQKGAMVFMSGYKENGIILMDYFGVLMPSGDKMMVHSGSGHARLPNYIHTSAPYGPIGATPIIHKQ